MAESHPTIPPFPSHIDRIAFGHWLSGFCDGEACFTLDLRARTRVGSARFTLGLRGDDRPILELIRSYWGCGHIKEYERRSRYRNECPSSHYYVADRSDLANILVPHFERFPMMAKKARDFDIWKEGVAMAYRIKGRPRQARLGIRYGGRAPSWTPEEIAEFEAIREALVVGRRYDGAIAPPPVKRSESYGQGMLW